MMNMKIREEILINQYGQFLVDKNEVLIYFDGLTEVQKLQYLLGLVELILQSKPCDCDIKVAIENSQLRPTYTPCILLAHGGIKYHNLKKIVDLPSSEQLKTLVLFLNLFRVSYRRRFEEESNKCDKWWYSDLSDERNVDLILKQFGG